MTTIEPTYLWKENYHLIVSILIVNPLPLSLSLNHESIFPGVQIAFKKTNSAFCCLVVVFVGLLAYQLLVG